MHFHSSRRAFLKLSLLSASALIFPEETLANFSSKQLPTGKLNLYNTHTGETLNIRYRERNGKYHSQAIKEINWILRCHYSNLQHPIDYQTLDFLDRLSSLMGANKSVHIICGYRSPEYNNYLISRGHKVARHSLHMEGRAIDIRIPGIDLSKLKQAALSLHLGGVGYYPGRDFVHIDSGAFRAW